MARKNVGACEAPEAVVAYSPAPQQATQSTRSLAHVVCIIGGALSMPATLIVGEVIQLVVLIFLPVGRRLVRGRVPSLTTTRRRAVPVKR